MEANKMSSINRTGVENSWSGAAQIKKPVLRQALKHRTSAAAGHCGAICVEPENAGESDMGGMTAGDGCPAKSL
jgi:hypothetical protein